MILVTGANGKLGSYVSRELRKKGHTVLELISPRATPKSQFQYRCDLTTGLDKFHDPLTHVATIVHCAGKSQSRSPKTLWATNVDGSKAVVELARAIGARLIFVSSLDVRWSKDSFYARSKLSAEAEVRTLETGFVVLRPSLILYSDVSLPAFVVPLPNRGLSLIQPVRVENLLGVIRLCIENELQEGIYEVAGERQTNLAQFVVSKARGRVVLPLPAWVTRQFRLLARIPFLQTYVERFCLLTNDKTVKGVALMEGITIKQQLAENR